MMQVVPDYYGEQLFDAGGGLSTSLQQYRDRHQVRAMEYLGLQDTIEADSTLRKKQRRYRIAAYSALKAFDNMRLQLTGHGVEQIKITKKQFDDLDDPYSWDSDNIVADQGSDILSMRCFASSSSGLLNLQGDDDLAHGCDNDFCKADRDTGLWAFRRLQRLARSAIYGPFDSKKRLCELREALQSNPAVMFVPP